MLSLVIGKGLDDFFDNGDFVFDAVLSDRDYS